jgi:hypothetical protein
LPEPEEEIHAPVFLSRRSPLYATGCMRLQVETARCAIRSHPFHRVDHRGHRTSDGLNSPLLRGGPPVPSRIHGLYVANRQLAVRHVNDT